MADLGAITRSGLLALLEQDPKAFEDLLFGQAERDIRRQAGDRAQQINENAFGRGLGLSTINAYSQAENQRARDEALGRARVDAATAARQAQLAALAQAAGVAQSEANRTQQDSQFRRAQKNQRSIANDQLLAGGLSALGGAGLGFGMKAFGPEAINATRGLAGLRPMYDTSGGAGKLGGGLVQSPGDAMTDSALSFGAGDPIDFSMPSFGGALNDFAIPDLSVPSVDFGSSLGGFGFDTLDALDPSLFSFGFSPLDLMVDPSWDWSF